jgi:hypothetical protein
MIHVKKALHLTMFLHQNPTFVEKALHLSMFIHKNPTFVEKVLHLTTFLHKNPTFVEKALHLTMFLHKNPTFVEKLQGHSDRNTKSPGCARAEHKPYALRSEPQPGDLVYIRETSFTPVT